MTKRRTGTVEVPDSSRETKTGYFRLDST
jgi:hypothetical protein